MGSKVKYPFTRIREPDMGPYLKAAVDYQPMNPENGYYGTLVVSGIEDMDRAVLIKRNLFNAARRMNYSLAASIQTVPGKDGKPDTYQVTYTPIDKQIARAYVIARYGTDKSKWPYRAGRQSSAA